MEAELPECQLSITPHSYTNWLVFVLFFLRVFKAINGVNHFKMQSSITMLLKLGRSGFVEQNVSRKPLKTPECRALIAV